MFNGEVDNKISLQEGATLTANYRNSLMNLFSGVKGGYIAKDGMIELLEQPDVVGFRYYYGLTEDVPALPQVVFVGVDSEGNDVTDGVILDKAELCPTICSIDNDLNS